MGSAPIRVQMLGELSIQRGSFEVNNSGDRSRKVWLLIAYMIYHRDRTVTTTELIDLVWGTSARSSNPANALKTMFHRARAMLNRLENGAGYELIVRRDVNYAWNAEVETSVDIDDFDRLCREAGSAKSEDQRLERLVQAARLYKGSFLEKLSNEPWVAPIAAHYHEVFIRIVQEVIPLLEARERWEDMAALCRTALEQEPCLEAFCFHLMDALLHLGDSRGAAAAYEAVSERIFTQLGIIPSDELSALYREATHASMPQVLTPASLMARLREPISGKGALLCNYDLFHAIYQCISRQLERTGMAAHVALITMTDAAGNELTKRSLKCVMGNLQELIPMQLRRGDVVTKCSSSQFVILLPQANYEDSRMVCQRINKAFCRQFPHSPATLRAVIQPLAPCTT